LQILNFPKRDLCLDNHAVIKNVRSIWVLQAQILLENDHVHASMAWLIPSESLPLPPALTLPCLDYWRMLHAWELGPMRKHSSAKDLLQKCSLRSRGQFLREQDLAHLASYAHDKLLILGILK
jgi:hypothetical protein